MPSTSLQDPCFREQFTIGGTGGSQGGSLAGSTGSGGLGGGRRTDERTEAYAQLLAQLPEVFVGTAEQLSEMVKALCTGGVVVAGSETAVLCCGHC
jgi:hypothetical protein